MVVYGYKPDTLVAVYPALQGTDAPRVHIFKNTAVYPADWLAENYRHYLKVRLILQQLQMVRRAELVNFAPPRPHIIIQIIAPLVRVVDFDLYGVFVFFCVLDNALTQLLSQSKQQKERRPVGFVTYERSGNK